MSHDHNDGPDDPEVRTRALESLLYEKGLLTPTAVDRVIGVFEQDLGPLHGARVIARTWVDPEYRVRLLDDASAAIAELGYGLADEPMVALENTPEVHNVVVCTLCSCYPWGVLGLPPRWYKDPAYRSRIVIEPRMVWIHLRTTKAVESTFATVRLWQALAAGRHGTRFTGRRCRDGVQADRVRPGPLAKGSTRHIWSPWSAPARRSSQANSSSDPTDQEVTGGDQHVV